MTAVPPADQARSLTAPRATPYPYRQDIRPAGRPGGLVELAQILLGVTLSLLSGLAVLLALGLLVALVVYLDR